MQKQFALSLRVVVELRGWSVSIDMKMEQPSFFIFNDGVAVNQVGFAISQRLDFGALQHDSNFEAVFDGKIVPRLFILTNNFNVTHDS